MSEFEKKILVARACIHRSIKKLDPTTSDAEWESIKIRLGLNDEQLHQEIEAMLRANRNEKIMLTTKPQNVYDLPAELTCQKCGTKYRIFKGSKTCPKCNKPRLSVIRGGKDEDPNQERE